MKLNQCKVKFFEAEHQYWLEDKQLSGITGLLRRQLFPDIYNGIDPKVLELARVRGSDIHSDIELFDSIGAYIDTAEVRAYKKIKEKHKLATLDNEYLVTDNTTYASCIDIVFDDCSLCDIKTTSSIHTDYVSWQLSIYAYLFELQNPHLKANKLYALWIPKLSYGVPKLVEMKRVSTAECKRLLECDVKGVQYTPLTKTSYQTIASDILRLLDDTPLITQAEIEHIENSIAIVKASFKKMEQTKLEPKKSLL